MQRIVKPAYHLPYETVGTPQRYSDWTGWQLNEDDNYDKHAVIMYTYHWNGADRVVTVIDYYAYREMSEQELKEAVYDSDTSLSFDIESINRTNNG